ncbi:hypothetical protein vseg_017427 [Gypsophila vaccaria]
MNNNNLLSNFIPISVFLLNLVSFALVCNASNSISQGQVLHDGQTLVSDDGAFVFGFFSPLNSSLRYVGIWYFDIPIDSVVWVANRLSPISTKNGSVSVGRDGHLRVLDGFRRKVWSSNTTVNSTFHRVILHDGGNLEISGFSNVTGSNMTCWQSFDHPTDTYLPGMKVVVNQNAGEVRVFRSWKSLSDPAPGRYSLGVDPRAAPQFVIWEGVERRWRSGHWDGIKFIGVPTMAAFYNYGFKLSNVDSSGNMYFSYSPLNMSNVFKFKVSWDGYERSLFWRNGWKEWSVSQSEPYHECDVYNMCGVNAYCVEGLDPICGCIDGFKPRGLDEWWKGNWSSGCVRKTELKCGRNNSNVVGRDGFVEVDGVKLPDFAGLFSDLDEKGCENRCLKNCSCLAYSYVTTIGCMTWSGDLFDIQHFPQGGNKLYVRVASSDIVDKGSLSVPVIVAIVLTGLILVCAFLLRLRKLGSKLIVVKTKTKDDGLRIRLRNGQGYSTDTPGSQEILAENTPDVSFFNFDIVASATDFFSEENKLGQGGFGPVYKGTLPGGREIAVKKLSRKSVQGMEEFKNEIMLIAQLQHRNLVRILGFSTLEDEKMLLYEYMPNKSLDCFIFDPVKRKQLRWRKQFTIIEGIARGLLYLHRDARCKIVHRDLKASNILLDEDLNPKISDFGMAKIFGGDQAHATTDRVVGTYGYMSPEYAMEGFFSERSDVYSFGILLLEVITGHKNARFRFGDHMSLVEYVWEFWSEGRTDELVDSTVDSSYSIIEVTRCVHIAILCVQDSAIDRPTMSQVVLWLDTDTLALPNPTKPTLTYSSSRLFIDMECYKGICDVESSNNLTITELIAR